MILIFIASISLILSYSFCFLSLTLFSIDVLLSRPNWACKHLDSSHHGDKGGAIDWRLHWGKISISYLIWVYFSLILVCLTCRCTNRPKPTCQPANSKLNWEKSIRFFFSGHVPHMRGFSSPQMRIVHPCAWLTVLFCARVFFNLSLLVCICSVRLCLH